MDALGVAPGRHPARSTTCGSFPSRTRPCCAKRSPTACSPCQWTRWWNCTRRRAPPASPSWWATTAHDMDVWSDCIARLAQMAGVVPRATGRRWRSATACSPAASACTTGCRALGCMMIPAGSGNTERHIAMIEDYGTTVLIATPSYALHMCEVGERHGLRLGLVHAARGPVRRRAVPARRSRPRSRPACTSCAPTTTA